MTDDGLLDPLPVFELVAGPDDELWLRIGDDAFPGRRWSELPWAFEYWKAGLLSLVAGTPARVDLQFFDGPYRALVDASSVERWTLTLWSNGRRREVVVEPSAFAGSVLRSARRRAACDDGPTFLADVKRALGAPTTTGVGDGDRPTEDVAAASSSVDEGSIRSRLLAAVESAWQRGCPVAGRDGGKIADVAIRRWNSFDRRNRRKHPTTADHVSDLTKGLVEQFEADPSHVGPLINDYRFLAEALAVVLVEEPS